LLEKTGYREYLKLEEDAEERLENIEEFKSILLQIEEQDSPLSREEKLEEAFDEAILSDDKLQNQRQSHDGITLSTIHSVKGLEFDYVFVIGLEENVFPNTYRFGNESELEEERRIAYVAFTRAKKRLYLLSAQNRLLYGERFTNKTSRFVLEFTGANNNVEEEKKSEFCQIEQVKINQENQDNKQTEIKKVEYLKADEKPQYHIDI
jgi:DNA helicase-2/ATP-dependent DNA helicase PcrA